MTKVLSYLLAVVGLCLTLLPSLLVFMHHIAVETHKDLMAVGMVCWFVGVIRLVKR